MFFSCEQATDTATDTTANTANTADGVTKVTFSGAAIENYQTVKASIVENSKADVSLTFSVGTGKSMKALMVESFDVKITPTDVKIDSFKKVTDTKWGLTLNGAGLGDTGAGLVDTLESEDGVKITLTLKSSVDEFSLTSATQKVSLEYTGTDEPAPETPDPEPEPEPETPDPEPAPAPVANLTVFVASSGDDSNEGTNAASPMKTVDAALAKVKADNADSSVTITIMGAVSLSSSISIDNSYPPIVLNGESGSKLDAGNKFRVLTITNGANVKLEGGLTLTGGNSNGVRVENATFTMAGGEITGNSATSGGGVYVTDGATFTMTGGTIANNSATNHTGNIGIGGGVHVGDNATFTMTGGTITGNTAKMFGGGVDVYYHGTFKKSGGIIDGTNTAGYEGRAVYYSGVKAASHTGRARNSAVGESIDLSTDTDVNWELTGL
jgi:hypothetical protein